MLNYLLPFLAATRSAVDRQHQQRNGEQKKKNVSHLDIFALWKLSRDCYLINGSW